MCIRDSLTGGMILSEAIMLELGQTMGRQEAHDLVYEAVERVLHEGVDFVSALSEDSRIQAHLNDEGVKALLDPSAYTGLCAVMANQQASKARELAESLT